MGDERPMTFTAAFWFNKYMSLPVFWLIKSDFYSLRGFSYKSALFQRGPFILQDQGQEEWEWRKEDKLGKIPFPQKGIIFFMTLDLANKPKCWNLISQLINCPCLKHAAKLLSPIHIRTVSSKTCLKCLPSTVDANDTLWYMNLALQIFLQIL